MKIATKDVDNPRTKSQRTWLGTINVHATYFNIRSGELVFTQLALRILHNNKASTIKTLGKKIGATLADLEECTLFEECNNQDARGDVDATRRGAR